MGDLFRNSNIQVRDNPFAPGISVMSGAFTAPAFEFAPSTADEPLMCDPLHTASFYVSLAYTKFFAWAIQNDAFAPGSRIMFIFFAFTAFVFDAMCLMAVALHKLLYEQGFTAEQLEDGIHTVRGWVDLKLDIFNIRWLGRFRIDLSISAFSQT